MDKVPDKIKEQIREFINNLLPEMPVDKVILFGSYAKGTARKDSDVDVAVFSQKFTGWKTVDILTFLLNKTMNLSIDLQPVGFPSEFEDNDFIRRIEREGIAVFERQQFIV